MLEEDVRGLSSELAREEDMAAAKRTLREVRHNHVQHDEAGNYVNYHLSI